MLRRINLKLAISVTIAVVAALGVAKEVFKIPDPLLVFIGGMYVACSIIFWSLPRRGRGSPFAQLAIWLVGWSFVTSSILGVVYYFDRAGWLWFKLTGYNETLAENFPERLRWPVSDFTARYPFFVRDQRDSTRLMIRSGHYQVDETIVVPPGLVLIIAPGTVLRFGAGCSLISYSPIIARGMENAPIVFTAKNKWLKWGAVGVIRAGQSIFEHVRFEHGRQALVNDIDFLGALSLIEAEAEVTQSRFDNLFGKDAAQVTGGQAFFRHNIFRDCFKDGLDFDGGTGEISHNRFEHCGDEAIDVGENSRVMVFGNVIIDAKDASKKGETKLSGKAVNTTN
ncbi:MAG: right-handed parallel beta-helix repeat-containing protein [candidate division KSB1 bacterium]|nr:right-handed parallel beta-helix repeat-containing protein [candidate division KSB1 bacterium]MDZ7364299.1 right-handed parallel beta-helix repeat-containing protein [candidate division KSB1 bacterium]MDZ7405022.1 right-handed parallel beta-helix repeat-containing protein [candidate division KSB1 bacterium]